MESQELIDLADKLIYKDNSDKACFGIYFSKLLLDGDFDAFVFLFIIWMNKYIENKLGQICDDRKYKELPIHMQPSVMAENMDDIIKWQSVLRKDFYEKTEWFIDVTKNTLKDNRRTIIPGLAECISVIGRNLSYSATKYDEKFERDWDVFSVMLALEFPSYARKHIKKEYVGRYLHANEFIKAHNVYVIQYYILCWDVYKTADQRKYKSDEYKHNYNRIAKILSDLPEVYRMILSGTRLCPSDERRIGEGGIYFILDVPFERFLPTFVKEEKRYSYCDNYKLKDGQRKRVCHPMYQVMIPCTSLFTRTDIDLYIESSYRKVAFEKIKNQIEVYEAGVEGSKEKTIQTDDRLKDYNIVNRDQLFEKLGNRSSKTVELLNALCPVNDKNFKKEVLLRMESAGFSRKLYYDLFSYDKNGGIKHAVPEKDTIIALTFCMQIGIEDANNLLISAGYVLSPAVERDIIIRHFIVNECYDLDKLNTVLVSIGVKPIKGKGKKKKL